MQWLEFIGPHGIGKTTLRRRLRKFAQLPRHPMRGRDYRPFADDLHFSWPTTWGCVRPDWNEFLRVIEGLYGEAMAGKPDADFKRRRNMCRAVVRMSMVADSDLDWVWTSDLLGSEGVRLSYQLYDPGRIEAYFEVMPISAGVVLLEADVPTIVDRNKKRDKGETDFSGYAARGVRACAIAKRVLAKRVPLLRLDATQSVEDNLQRIVEFAGFKAPTQ